MCWESGIHEDWRRFVYQSPRLPRRTVLTTNLHHGRQDTTNFEARASDDHHSKRSEGSEETRSGNIDFRIQGLRHSAVQKEDLWSQRKWTRNWSTNLTHTRAVTRWWRLWTRLRNSISSAKGRRSWSAAWVTRSTSSCARFLLTYSAQIVLSIGMLASYTAPWENACSRRKEIDSWTKDRYDVWPIPDYVIRKNPSHGARHGPTVRQKIYHKSTRHAEESSQAQKVVVAEPFWKDGTMMTNTASLCQILGGLRNRSFNMTQSHWKVIPTWLQERSRWNISLNAEGFQGPLNQRGECTEAKQKRRRLCDEYVERTGEGNRPIPPAQQTRQRREQQFEGLDEDKYTVDLRTGWRFYPSSRPTPSSSSTHWEQHDDWKSNKSWDSWRTSSWTEPRHAQESPEETVQYCFGKVVQRRSPPRFFVSNRVEWRNHNGLRQDRIGGPLLHCDERGNMSDWISAITSKKDAKDTCKRL